MVEKKVVQPLKPKKSKVIFTPEDKIISPPKFKTRQTDVKKHIRLPDIMNIKVRKHKRTVRKK